VVNIKEKYRLARYNIICQPKGQGGLGILNIDVQNRCLLSKWLFKLINEEGIWQTMMRHKYLRTQTIRHVQRKPSDSHFLSGLMKVKDSFLSLGHMKLNNGENIHFWEDRWSGNFSLQHQYPSLYAITQRKNISVTPIRLNGVRDKFMWGVLQSGLFSVNSMYKALILDTWVRDSCKHLGPGR
jgi:hypothetical protein